MNLINNIIDELKISNNYFVPTVIEEINTFVIHKLTNIIEIYKIDLNKYYLLGNLVNLGYELENNILVKNNNILSLQLNFLNGLFEPIINKIREVCLEINIELVNEIKNQIGNLIMSDLNKYDLQKKNIKFVQVNCFCKNQNYSVNKEVLFDDFGISIKITNYHFKDIFKELIEETDLPIKNNNLKDKKSDWSWKAFEFKNYNNFFNNIKDQNIFDTNYVNQNNNMYDNLNNIIDDVESFKIVQKNPESIQSLQKTNILIDSTFNNNINIIKPSEKQISKIISNSIIIEDDSFSIPIDFNDNLTLTNFN